MKSNTVASFIIVGTTFRGFLQTVCIRRHQNW